jgi:hypothetical protein
VKCELGLLYLSLTRLDQQNQKGHYTPAQNYYGHAGQIRVELVRFHLEKVEYLFAVVELFHANGRARLVTVHLRDASELVDEQVLASVPKP